MPAPHLKNGKTIYFHPVLEARLITPNGFSISIATEWIENPEGGEYDKQDCERKAFTRLAATLKKVYPRLPIVILADGLYPYEGFFAICKTNQWAFLLSPLRMATCPPFGRTSGNYSPCKTRIPVGKCVIGQMAKL